MQPAATLLMCGLRAKVLGWLASGYPNEAATRRCAGIVVLWGLVAGLPAFSAFWRTIAAHNPAIKTLGKNGLP